MPYIRRGPDGKIAAVFHEPVEDGLDSVGPDDPELTEYLYQNHPDEAQRRQFMESDLGLARVLNLIDVGRCGLAPVRPDHIAEQTQLWLSIQK